MGNSIREGGKISVCGVFLTPTGPHAQVRFWTEPAPDCGLAVAESGPQAFCSGHTDSVGQTAANMTLSANRAATVGAALTRKGIAAGRLSSTGVGRYCPVASKRNEEGKAHNKRVELMEMAN
ncbi:MAG: OmpA family protein [Desulfobulbus sp.]|nr:OmpA family protein [Desulfobulbus sp.]